MRTRRTVFWKSSLMPLATVLGGCRPSDASAPPPPTGGQPPLEVPSLPAPHVAWLEAAVVPLSDDDPAQRFDDLAPRLPNRHALQPSMTSFAWQSLEDRSGSHVRGFGVTLVL